MKFYCSTGESSLHLPMISNHPYMKKLFSFFIFYFLLFTSAWCQNVGVNIISPTEKLHVDSGNIKIGNAVWQSPANARFLKFGDGDYIKMGEEEADDKLTIRAKEIFIRPSTSYTTVPLTIQGSAQNSHFYFDVNEDTYIRGGKASSNGVSGSELGGRVGISVYPQRAGLEQNGAVGTTSAIFGGEGAGISLQRNWPVVGFNHYYNAGQKSMAAGWVGYLALNQSDGSLYFDSFGDYAASGANQDMGNPTTQFSISRRGNTFVNGNISINNSMDGTPLFVRTSAGNAAFVNTSGIRMQTDGNVFPWNIYVGGNQFRFASNGNTVAFINPNDGSYSSISDINAKKGITGLQTLLPAISELRPVTYLMKTESEGSKKHYGFISQEIEKIFPELVTETADIKMMNYSGLIPILTKGIQEQQIQIELLQKENAAIKESEKNLLKEFQQLKKQIELISEKISSTNK